MSIEPRTEQLLKHSEEENLDVAQITVITPTGQTSFAQERVTIGSHPSSDVVISDSSVSRAHAEIRLYGGQPMLVDCGSSNGTFLDGVRIKEAYLRRESRIALGRAELVVRHEDGRSRVPTSIEERFGTLVGRAPRTRALFSLLARIAATDATVLLEGETGTGKEAVAESLHAASPRAKRPFVVVDCSAIPHELVESELFGHERGSFTGATNQRRGAFEEADRGTLFLDEIGELPPELQPKLLRALEQREIRRVGGNTRIPVDLRVIAATHRHLDVEVNEGRFRADLFFRLAVVRVSIPPLRDRLEDLPVLVETLLGRLGANEESRVRYSTPAFYERLRRSDWPGNVRQLRNTLERFLVLGEELTESSPTPRTLSESVDARLSYAVSREQALGRFERAYVTALLDLHEGNVSKAAREAGLDRAYLHRLIRRAKADET